MHSEDDVFIDRMADAVQRHVRMALATPIENAHVELELVPSITFDMDFGVVWRDYNQAMFECIRSLVRYERLLRAWVALIDDFDDDIRLTCLADYAWPVLRVACDVPLEFKNQFAKGMVKLEHLARGDVSILKEDGSARRGNYFYDELRRLEEMDPDLRKIQSFLNDDLYRSSDARHLIDIHGSSFHDAHSSLMNGRETAVTLSEGLTVIELQDSVSLEAELEVLQRQRLRLQQGYKLFNDRARYLDNARC